MLQILRLVVASPADVQQERDLLERVAVELNRGIAADRDLRIELVRWETDTHPGFHVEGPQGLIDSTLRIDDCDILIGIFWKRFGTPVASEESGTAHEIRMAYASWKQTGRPDLMIYFNQQPYAVESRAEAEQWALVLKFKDEFPKEGLWWSYHSASEFEQMVRRHLTQYIRRNIPLSGLPLPTSDKTTSSKETSPPDRPTGGKSKIGLFLVYAQQDLELRNQLATHLSVLKRQGVIDNWYERRVVAGEEVGSKVNEHLEAAQIILLLVSPDFVASDYCYDFEISRALEKHRNREARVIPVILRPVEWMLTPFGKLQGIPQDGRPVTSWKNIDEAWLDIASSLRHVSEEMRHISSENVVSTVKGRFFTRMPLHKVFLKSGVPNVTFVEPPDYNRLKMALLTPGRGVVIEGPSGVGKTTALKKAIQQLGSNMVSSGLASTAGDPVPVLSARNPRDIERLTTLRKWHQGTIAIDDFHRLGAELSVTIVNYLKDLADNDEPSKKLVLVGIPGSGQTLVDASYDVAMRIEFFKLSKIPIDLIIEMIEKGEQRAIAS